MMLAEKIRNILLTIIGFITGIFATIVAVYLFGTDAIFIIITVGIVALTLRLKLRKLTNEIEYLKREINQLKEKH